MKVFLDTNVLVAASIRQHPHFLRADAVMQACVEGQMQAVVHAHSLLEFHSAVTQLPGGLSVPSAQVPSLLAEGILPFVRLTALSPDEVVTVQQRAGTLALVGGIIYDLYLLMAAERDKVDRLYTFNTAHFQALAPPEFSRRIVAP